MPSALEPLVAGEIRATGPIPLARYMELALGHPELGYYRRRDARGMQRDFTTAPEISQMFGEIVGLWLAEAWVGLGRPAPVRLVELGPGRGTMMADVLRAMNPVPDLPAALHLHLVETGEALRALQHERLRDRDPTWHADLDDVPDGPMLLVANEFLDALPVHQLVRRRGRWVERRVGLDEDGRLAFVTADAPSPLAAGLADAAEGAIAEVGPARAALAAAVARRLAAAPGVALFVDYGAWTDGPTGDTLQAVRAGRHVDPLEAPGEADLTSHVDFRAFADAAARSGAAVYGPVPQGTFLRALGIEMRAVALLERAAPEQRRDLRAGLFRLTDAAAMGELFKVLALAGATTPPPPGFDAATLRP